MFRFSAVLLVCGVAFSQVKVHVDATQTNGPVKPVWNYFGYDEPNYTYAPNGRLLLSELAKLDRTPVQIRTHNLLTTGDGTAALKWGSTNAYTEDASGQPVYNWAITDRILDTYVATGVQPFVEIGFMPKALSVHPDPYQHAFPKGGVYTGWSYPPNDYVKWGELVYQFAKHVGEKYGIEKASRWNWEVWNEPNIEYWHGTPEEYDHLYDVTAASVRRALPEARVGGPASTGPGGPKAAAFLRQFLEHCAKTKAPLDFISFHAKGHPEAADGHMVMGLKQELTDAAQGFQIVHSFPQFQKLPIILTEADPEGCAACSSRTNPNNAYRNGSLYPAYEAVSMKALVELAAEEQVNLAGVLTWAFEFEGQPYFDGLRTLATNRVDKPVLNAFRMLGQLSGDWIPVHSDGAVAVDSLRGSGVRGRTDVDGWASRNGNKVVVMLWNYQDEEGRGPAANVELEVSGVPAKHVHVQQFRIDETHSNSFTAWKAMGSPQQPTPSQQAELQRSGQLQALGRPEKVAVHHETAELKLELPAESLSLLELSW